MTELQYMLGALAGTAVGFTLGLVGGGGSILAVPLMVYLVGVDDPHVAIGTSTLAVAANALVGLTNHARKQNVKWRCASTFAAAGVQAGKGLKQGRFTHTRLSNDLHASWPQPAVTEEQGFHVLHTDVAGISVHPVILFDPCLSFGYRSTHDGRGFRTKDGWGTH